MTKPKLRFTENDNFYSDWVKITLKDLAMSSKGGTLSKSDLDPQGSIPCLLYGELYTTYTEVTNKVVSRTNITTDLVKSQNGDVVLPMSGETAEDIAKATCLKQEGVAYGGDLLVLRSDEVDGAFLSYSLNSINRRQIARIAQGKTVVHINWARLSNIAINIPSLEEQRKISDFLTTLDKKIEISRKRINILENIGNNILNKIFSREKRFKKSNGSLYENWGNTTIENISKVSSGKRVHRSDWKKEGIPFYRTSDIMSVLNGCKNQMGDAFISKSLYDELTRDNEKLEKNDLLITGGGSVGVPYIVSKTPLYTKDADLLWLKPDHNKVNSKFLYYFFFSKEFRRYLASISHSGTIAHYTISQLKNTPILLPELEEQEKIVAFLNSFYKKTEIEKKKLKLLNDLKRSLLNQMLI